MNALVPASPQAQSIATLFWWMLGVAASVYLIVVVLFFLAGFRRRQSRPGSEWAGVGVDRGQSRPGSESAGVGVDPAQEPIHEVPPATTRRLTIAVSIGVAITVVILFAFLIVDFGVGRALAATPNHALIIKVTGHQWWWEFQYQDTAVSRLVTTANEIHVPVGEPVLLQLTSADVIHSFWVPNLRGKKDLVPGYKTTTWFTADTAGTYRGQCAEFCGYEHAMMAFYVIAEPRERFESWLAAQRTVPPEPTDSVSLAGQQVFLAGPCSSCHTIAGTPARGTIGPNLTHLASRLTIGAGTLPNTKGHLGGWIVNPQTMKPGVDMPPNNLSPADLQALLAYLGTLK